MGVDVHIIAATNTKLGGDEFAKELSYIAGSAFGYQKFFIMNHENMVQRAIEYQYDPEGAYNGKVHLYHVNVWSRYFGPEYPRGDWPFLNTLIDFLRYRIEDADIWYLSDGNTEGAEYRSRPFTVEDQKKMSEFCYSGTVYTVMPEVENPVQCDFCERPMILGGWIKGSDLFVCPGCGQKIKRDPMNHNNFEILANPGGLPNDK